MCRAIGGGEWVWLIATFLPSAPPLEASKR
jgi:hypothetical protein